MSRSAFRRAVVVAVSFAVGLSFAGPAALASRGDGGGDDPTGSGAGLPDLPGDLPSLLSGLPVLPGLLGGALPVPGLPALSGLPVPGLPALSGLGLPGLPAPGLPAVPGILSGLLGAGAGSGSAGLSVTAALSLL